MRWHLVVPLGEPFFYHRSLCTILTVSEALPHMATNDDEYDGYYIPKGTVVLGNAWPVRTTSPTSYYPNFLVQVHIA